MNKKILIIIGVAIFFVTGAFALVLPEISKNKEEAKEEQEKIEEQEKLFDNIINPIGSDEEIVVEEDDSNIDEEKEEETVIPNETTTENKPVIVPEQNSTDISVSLNGESIVTVEVNTKYEDPLIKTSSSDLKINVVGEVNIKEVGEYKLTYYGSDTKGNISNKVSRTVKVVDTTKPIITLKGNSSEQVQVKNNSVLNTLYKSFTRTSNYSNWSASHFSIFPTVADYNDQGVDVVDNYNKDIQYETSNNLNQDKPGKYTFNYEATDSSNNSTTASRSVYVVDTTKPIIIPLGDEEVNVSLGFKYVDKGALGLDNYDGDVTSRITKTYCFFSDIKCTQVDGINANIAGEYRIMYNLTDTSKNKAVEVIRTVNVK